MSLSWFEPLRLQVGPDSLLLSRRGQPLGEAPLEAGWAGALAALPTSPTWARLHVEVADRHARYLRLAWPEGLRRTERQVWVASRFHSVFGSGPWLTLADRDAFRLPALAAALPTGLVEALKVWATERRLRLTSLQAAFVADYNRHCRHFHDDGAFARREDGRLTLGLWRDGQWQAVRSQPLACAGCSGEALGQLLATLPAARAVAAGTLYIAGSPPPPASLPAGWQALDLESMP